MPSLYIFEMMMITMQCSRFKNYTKLRKRATERVWLADDVLNWDRPATHTLCLGNPSPVVAAPVTAGLPQPRAGNVQQVQRIISFAVHVRTLTRYKSVQLGTMTTACWLNEPPSRYQCWVRWENTAKKKRTWMKQLSKRANAKVVFAAWSSWVQISHD